MITSSLITITTIKSNWSYAREAQQSQEVAMAQIINATVTSKLPVVWQSLFDWCQQRHLQPAETYKHADKLWKAMAPMILNDMSDAEVEQFADALSAEHGSYNGQPDITDRIFPKCLFTRLGQIARRKAFAEQHQNNSYRLAHFDCMVALHVKAVGDKWAWEVIHDHIIDASGTAKTESEAWAKVEDQWNISRSRLTLASKEAYKS